MSEMSNDRPPDAPPVTAGGRRGALRPKDKLLLAVHLPLVAVLVLPIAPVLWSGEASLFGLPRSIVTIVGLLCCSFLAVLVHFRSDAAAPDAGAGEEQD